MFVLRKVKNNRVRVGERDFFPENRHLKYDGRFEGMTLTFGLYETDPLNKDSITYCGRKYLPYIYFWGTEAEYKSRATDSWFNESHLWIVDGTIPWAIWRTNGK